MSTADASSIVPFVHHPAWSGWERAAHRSLSGGVVGTSEPVYGLAMLDAPGAEPRALSAEEILALGDPAAIEARAVANLDRMPFTLEPVERTKGVLGFGKKPLTVVFRGALAPERVLSPVFLEAARALLGNPQRMAVGIPNRATIFLRNHDEPHFGSAFSSLGDRVRAEYASGAAHPVCNGVGIVEENRWGSGYVRPPEPAPGGAYPFPARALAEPSKTLQRSKPEDLEPMPALAPTGNLPIQFLGRHRTGHHLEVAIEATTAAQLGDPARAAIARMAQAVPGTLVVPITGVRLLLSNEANATDLEWCLRHPNVHLCVPGPNAKTLRLYSGPSARAATDNLSKPMAELR
jgi:hypothetical protein